MNQISEKKALLNFWPQVTAEVDLIYLPCPCNGNRKGQCLNLKGCQWSATYASGAEMDCWPFSGHPLHVGYPMGLNHEGHAAAPSVPSSKPGLIVCVPRTVAHGDAWASGPQPDPGDSVTRLILSSSARPPTPH